MILLNIYYVAGTVLIIEDKTVKTIAIALIELNNPKGNEYDSYNY